MGQDSPQNERAHGKTFFRPETMGWIRECGEQACGRELVYLTYIEL